MFDGSGVALKVARACADALTASGLPADVVARLSRYANRHLPLEESAEGSAFVPPMYAIRVAEYLELAPSHTIDFAAAGCLFFAAADLADDCADGDVRRSVGLDVNDTCHLLFAQQHQLLSLDCDAATRCALGILFAESGQEMAVGQAADLVGTDAIEVADPVDIALGKSGGEAAAFFAGPAIIAGLDPEPWRRFGRALGAMAQVLTDYFDLFLDPTSDDWTAAKPTVPLRFGMEHPAHGAELRSLLAGNRVDADRKAMGLWLLTQCGVGDQFEVVLQRLLAQMLAAERELNDPPVLAAIRAEIEEWCRGVIDALEVYTWDKQPVIKPLTDEVETARRSAWAYLRADGALTEACEIRRDGLFGVDLVEGGLLGRALAIDALQDEPVDVTAARVQIFALADADGWRYHPGHVVLPTAADCVGAMMQIAQTTSERTHSAMKLGSKLMRRADNLDEHGMPSALLADGARFTRPGIDADWDIGECPGSAAIALTGLWRWGDRKARSWVRSRVPSLADSLLREQAPGRYPSPVTDYLVVRCLLEAGGDDPRIGGAIAVAAARARARRTVRGTMGDTLSTAMGGWLLARTGTLDRPEEVVRALVDAQDADGGYTADRLRRSVPRPAEWYGSRIVTTAYVLQALRVIL